MTNKFFDLADFSKMFSQVEFFLQMLIIFSNQDSFEMPVH